MAAITSPPITHEIMAAGPATLVASHEPNNQPEPISDPKVSMIS